MRYLCLNQAGQRKKFQAPTIADNLHKRDLEETMGYEATNRDGLVPTRKAKRFRSAFTTEQIKYLETEFKKYPYIGSARRKEVSNALNITERAVKIWFQNRRMKEKKDRTSNETDCEEHKNSRKVDVANDQLNNECTVTSTNNQHYALLPLMSPKNIIPKNIESLEKENEIDVLSDERPNRKVIIDTKNSNNKASAEFSIQLYKQYNNYIAKPEHSLVNPTLQKKKHVNPVMNSTHDVSSTSPYEKLPQDLSRKRKQPQVKTMGTPQIPTGGYFPLNLKKYNAQPSLPVGGSMVWKPVQVVPVMPGSGMTISSDQMESLSMATLPAQGAKDCCCDCRCHPSPSGPVLLQQSATNPLAQYVLTALPLPNPYFEY